MRHEILTALKGIREKIVGLVHQCEVLVRQQSLDRSDADDCRNGALDRAIGPEERHGHQYAHAVCVQFRCIEAGVVTCDDWTAADEGDVQSFEVIDCRRFFLEPRKLLYELAVFLDLDLFFGFDVLVVGIDDIFGF